MEHSRRARGKWKLFLPLGASILGLCTLKLLDPHLVSREQLLGWLHPLGGWTPLAYLALLTVRGVTLLPGQLLTAIGGLLFGGLAGTLYALVGSFLNAAVIFFIGRRWGARLVRRAFGERTAALEAALRENDFLFALVFTLNPLVPTDPMLALAGCAGARFWRTMAGTLLGIVPGTLATAYFGSALAAGHPWVIALSVSGWAISVIGGIWVAFRLYREVMTPDLVEPKPPGRVPRRPVLTHAGSIRRARFPSDL
jgi:uncharacterized membrane protein YdjX (TVP38/TMEM64 family)